MDNNEILRKVAELKRLGYGRGKISRALGIGEKRARNLMKKTNKIRTSKILLLDIETAPYKGYVWRCWKQNIAPVQMDGGGYVLTWVAKWLLEPDIFSDYLTGEEIDAEDDSRIVGGIYGLLNEADIVIGHNAKKFDLRRLNSRFIKAGLSPPLPYQIIDTLLHARKSFDLPHYSLDYLGQYSGVGRKVKNSGFELWKNVLTKVAGEIELLEEYNKGDVALLEDVYLWMLPWIKPHPNLALIIKEDRPCCASCESDNLTWQHNSTFDTGVNSYPVVRCNACGALGVGRKTLTPEKSKIFLVKSITK